MAWFTGLFDIFKGGEKALAKDVVKTELKSASSDVIKTTSKITGSAEKAVAGGQGVLKSAATDLAKGVGSTAKIGGKVVGVTAITAGAALTANQIYNTLANSWAMTEAQRQYQDQINLSSQDASVTKKAQDQYLKYLQGLSDANASGGSLAAGGAGANPFGVSSTMPSSADTTAATEASASASKTMWYVIGGVALLVAGTYVYSKKANYARSK